MMVSGPIIAPPQDFNDLRLITLTIQGKEWSTADKPPVIRGVSIFAGKICGISDLPQSNKRWDFVGLNACRTLFQIQLKKWFSTGCIHNINHRKHITINNFIVTNKCTLYFKWTLCLSVWNIHTQFIRSHSEVISNVTFLSVVFFSPFIYAYCVS